MRNPKNKSVFQQIGAEMGIKPSIPSPKGDTRWTGIPRMLFQMQHNFPILVKFFELNVAREEEEGQQEAGGSGQ